MIRCVRCGAPASLSSNGIMRLSCSCPSLNVVQYQAQPCPLCGEPVFVREYHRCRGIGAVPAPQPAPMPTMSEVSLPRAKKILEKITADMMHHDKTCDACKMLGRSCLDRLHIEATYKKWQKRVESIS